VVPADAAHHRGLEGDVGSADPDRPVDFDGSLAGNGDRRGERQTPGPHVARMKNQPAGARCVLADDGVAASSQHDIDGARCRAGDVDAQSPAQRGPAQ